MNELPQCWAFNTVNERCDKKAGHTGNHAITRSWTDDECVMPSAAPRPTTPPVAPPEPVAPVKCIACKHMHKGGICQCGCHEHIG